MAMAGAKVSRLCSITGWGHQSLLMGHRWHHRRLTPIRAMSLEHARALQLYEVVWSQGKVWQPPAPEPSSSSSSSSSTGGRQRLKRGILAYRAAYPDIRFTVLACAECGTPSPLPPHAPAPPASPPASASSSSVSDASTSPAGVGSAEGGDVGHSQPGEGGHAQDPSDSTKGPSSSPSHPPPAPASSSSSSSDGGDGGSIQCGSSRRSVFVHWSAAGTNTGSIWGSAPSGRTATFSGLSRLEFDEQGRIARSWVYRGPTSLLLLRDGRCNRQPGRAEPLPCGAGSGSLCILMSPTVLYGAV
ncbi:hypothetical protein QJQ45_000942 [Haematococcus lacustris]|nr:hypothetical protein QJQ45_000942 [Haematococcus lacustris]